MPIVEITLVEGRDQTAKKRLVEKVTDAIIESIAAPRDSVRIILREIPGDHFAVGGVLKGAAKAPSPG
jgi:4-oxalocrotonate tautomerase